MTSRRLRLACGVVGLVATLLTPDMASARPLYFDHFVALYGFTPGDDLYACGVCHRRWEGTGGRNPYGLAVEQQLYLGKPILDALMDIEGVDTDLDGFTNIAELSTHGTLPGYSCDNHTLVVNPPPNFQSLITPGVPSCLEPKDLAVAPLVVAFVNQVGTPETTSVELINNGTDFPITVSSAELLPGAPATLSIVAPAVPFPVPVGGTVLVDLTFAPTSTIATNATLRITSDDPDEPTIDVSISLLAFTSPIAPASARAACLASVQRQYRRYSKRHLKEWSRCYLDEIAGRACDSGLRDLRLMRAEESLRDYLGGERDQACAGNGLSPTLLGFPGTCAAPCDHIGVVSFAGYADCLVCQQNASTSAVLDAAAGVAPPDLPMNTVSGLALKCQRYLLSGAERGVGKILKNLADCELDNVTAATPVDCTSTNAAELSDAAAKVDSRLDLCQDTTGLQGCLFGMTPAPTCLGDTSLAAGSTLTDTIFGLWDD